MLESKINDISVIQNLRPEPICGPEFLSEEATANARRIHRALPTYEPTPLVRLDAMAKRMGVRAVFVKDESKRWGLNAFKALGGLYALVCIIAEEFGLDIETLEFANLMKPELNERIRKMVFVTATDGNHGRGLAWAAGQLGCETHVYMPVGSTENRAQAIRDVNPRAEVVITDMGYDDAVRYAAGLADENGWYLVQDSAWDGYEKVPTWIVQGYTTMAAEACDELDRLKIDPTHVFVQAGVGAMAGGVTGYMMNRYEPGTLKYGNELLKVCVVEPDNMACIYESARCDDRAAHAAVDQGPTIMAGLNCGEPCTVTWPVLDAYARRYVRCPDYVTEYGMRLLAKPEGDDKAIVSGESGAVTAGLINLACSPGYEELKKLLKLNKNSVILLFSTEGDTDPDCYMRIVQQEE